MNEASLGLDAGPAVCGGELFICHEFETNRFFSHYRKNFYFYFFNRVKQKENSGEKNIFSPDVKLSKKKKKKCFQGKQKTFFSEFFFFEKMFCVKMKKIRRKKISHERSSKTFFLQEKTLKETKFKKKMFR